MCSYRLLAAILALTMLGLAAVLCLRLSTPAPGVTPENFERIREGMSVNEVEVLLGAKAIQAAFGKSWVGPTYHALVLFDEDGRARSGGIGKIDGSGHPRHLRDEPSLLGRLRCLFGW
jgi:hypothetical protein